MSVSASPMHMHTHIHMSHVPNADNDRSPNAEAALQFMSSPFPSLCLVTTVQGQCGGNDYVIVSDVAKGGFGEVYRGIQKDDGKKFALKRSIWHKKGRNANE